MVPGYDVFGPKGGTQRNQNLWIPNVQIYMCCATCRAGESSNSHSGGRQQRKRYGDTPPVIYWRAVFSVFSRMAVFPSFPDDEQTIERERENIATYYYTVVRSTSYVASYVVESRYMLHTCNGWQNETNERARYGLYHTLLLLNLLKHAAFQWQPFDHTRLASLRTS